MDEAKSVEVLTRDKAVPKGILPTGRTIGIKAIKGSGLFEIKYIDDKPGDVPDKYAGKYTGLTQATRHMNEFLNDFWDLSDKSASRKKQPINAVSG